MDERETVPRREAMVGLSLLGIFSLALTGTLAYRIVYPTKHVMPKVVVTNEWKSQGPLPTDPDELFGPAASAPQLANDEFPTVDPIPTTAVEAPSVPATAIEEVPAHSEEPAATAAPWTAPPPDVAPDVTPIAAPSPAPTPAPTLVAPSYR